jgi:hypothetical protein
VASGPVARLTRHRSYTLLHLKKAERKTGAWTVAQTAQIQPQKRTARFPDFSDTIKRGPLSELDFVRSDKPGDEQSGSRTSFQESNLSEKGERNLADELRDDPLSPRHR